MYLLPDMLQDTADAQCIPLDLQDILLEYVNENCCSSSLCLTAAADYIGSSIYAVSRTFKERTGVGFKEYITAKRLQHACQLLETTELSVSKISAASGFENSTYFTTVFKREFGMPPSKYRTSTRRTEKF